MLISIFLIIMYKLCNIFFVINKELKKYKLFIKEKIDIHPTPEARSSRAMLCLSLTAMLLLMLGFTSGLTVYREYMSASTRRYQGFCSIPLPNDIREVQMHKICLS